ncbi:hypothetical protein ACUYF5_24520 (plasmid) [Escherichia coli]
MADVTLQSDTNTNKYCRITHAVIFDTGDSNNGILVALTRKNIDVYSKGATVDLKKGMKFTRVNVPSGAVQEALMHLYMYVREQY